jgi:hypothetical protein
MGKFRGIFGPGLLARQPLLRKKGKGFGGKGRTAVSPWNAIIGIFMCID